MLTQYPQNVNYLEIVPDPIFPVGDDAQIGDAGNDDAQQKISKPTKIYQLAIENCSVFTGTDGATYASASVGGHNEITPIKSTRFRQWLGKLYYDRYGSVAGKSSCEEAIELLGFQPEEDQRETFLRVGHDKDGNSYIDLGDAQWQTIKVSAKGWEILNRSPISFRRTQKMLPLPTPQRVANRDEVLREFFGLVNVAVEDRPIVLAWMLAAMRSKGPYPILTLIAEAGSAKTTTTSGLKRVISPYVAKTRARPKTVENVYVAANNDWVLVYDNLSSIPQDISDAFCRLSTGGGHATRELYTDMDEAVSDNRQPLIINGITDMIKKGDLMSRSLPVRLPEITAEKRISEDEWERRFVALHPRILGALVSLLSEVMVEMPNVKLKEMPRMADFAKLGAALDRVLKIEGSDKSFTKRYDENIVKGTLDVIEASPIYRPLYRFIKGFTANKDTCFWEGSAGELLENVRRHAKDSEKFADNFPRQDSRLSWLITEIAPNLRAAKIIDCRKLERTKTYRSRLIVQILSNFEDCNPDDDGGDTETKKVTRGDAQMQKGDAVVTRVASPVLRQNYSGKCQKM